MARRKAVYTVPGKRSDAPGARDNGKTFIVIEMAADEGELWADQLLFLIAKSGREIPDGTAGAGMAGLAAAGVDILDVLVLRALQDPSLESMWECIKYQHDPNHPLQPIFKGEQSQIEEISTRHALRMEVVRLHLNFSGGAEPQTSAKKAQRSQA